MPNIVSSGVGFEDTRSSLKYQSKENRVRDAGDLLVPYHSIASQTALNFITIDIRVGVCVQFAVIEVIGRSVDRSHIFILMSCLQP